MFKGFSNNSGFNFFPNSSFIAGMKDAYGVNSAEYWIDAGDLINLSNLAAVSRWSDKISGISFEQTVAGNQPRFVLSNPNYNNLPTVEAIDNARILTANFGILLAPEWTVVLVANYGIINTISIALTNSSLDNGFGPGGGFAGINGAFCRTSTSVSSGTTESNTPKIMVFSRNTGIMVNGSLESSSPILGALPVFNRLFRGTASNVALNGNIAEIIVYSKSMTINEMQLVSTNLNSKYALY